MLLQRGRWEQFKHYWCVQLFSAVSSLIVCCSARACEGSCSQHGILWLLAALPASQALRARVQRAPLTKQAESFLDLVFFFFYWKIITWNPDQVSVVMLKKPQWHQSIRLSVFSIRALKALLTSTIKPFQLNDRNPLFTVQFYTHATMSNFFQNFKGYRNLNRSKANCPELLCPQLFKMTTSETSRRWRV